MKINEFFNEVFLINLKRRPDRLKLSTDKLNKLGIEFTLFEAGDGKMCIEEYQTNIKPGQLGCLLSHLNLIKHAKEKDLSNLLILEDDVSFNENFNNLFKESVKELPEDWDMFYLGGNAIVGQNTKITDTIFKSNQVGTTHSYAIKNTIYDLILESNKYELPIDSLFTEVLNRKVNTYIISPAITFQDESFSDVQDGHRNYTFLKNRKIEL